MTVALLSAESYNVLANRRPPRAENMMGVSENESKSRTPDVST